MAAADQPAWQRVVIMRHGQSINVQRWLDRRNGHKVDMVAEVEDHLTDAGRAQVQQAAQALIKILHRPPYNHRQKVAVFTSPSTRCRETTNIVSKILQASGWTQGSLNIVDELQELKTHDYVASSTAMPDPIAAWNQTVFPADIHPHTVRLVVTHGNILKTALAQRWGWPSHLSLAPTLASLTVLDYNAQGQTVLHNLCDSSALSDQTRQWFNEDLFQ